MTKTEKRRARRQKIARVGKRSKTTTAPTTPTPNAGTQAMTTAPTTPTPNAGTQAMTTAPTTPEKSPLALVTQISAKTFDATTGKPTKTVWSIKNPSGTFWANRRGRRRAWDSREAAEASRIAEAFELRNVDRRSRGLEAIAPADAETIAPPPIPRLHNDTTQPRRAAPGDGVPDADRIGKFVSAAIALDPRIGRRIATEVMDVVTTLIRDA